MAVLALVDASVGNVTLDAQLPCSGSMHARNLHEAPKLQSPLKKLYFLQIGGTSLLFAGGKGGRPCFLLARGGRRQLARGGRRQLSNVCTVE